MKWEKVAVAPDQLTAEMWREILTDKGIPAMLQPGDVSSFLGISARPVGLLVPAADAQRAREILGELEEPDETES